MPLPTPAIKWRNVQRLGAEVILHGLDFDEAKKECARLTKEENLKDIPPFDDPYVIAGQGTIGMEILRQHDVSKISTIFIPVGGGGLIAGIGSYVKRIAPHIKIIGVEAVDACAMDQSLKEKKRVVLDEVGLFADGAAVRMVGEETYRLAQSLIDEVVLVSNDEICAAIKDVFEDTRSSMLESQAKVLDQIETSAIETTNQLEAGTQYIEKAKKSALSTRRNKFICLGIFLVIIIIIIIVLAVKFAPSHNNNSQSQ
ncbi:Putative Threonine ammonia-lyase, biosynthetic [Rhizopus microsporus]|nr:Putative Threonine ammonia-lyase, biosynthetic [Rhizopus microsporus]